MQTASISFRLEWDVIADSVCCWCLEANVSLFTKNGGGGILMQKQEKILKETQRLHLVDLNLNWPQVCLGLFFLFWLNCIMAESCITFLSLPWDVITALYACVFSLSHTHTHAHTHSYLIQPKDPFGVNGTDFSSPVISLVYLNGFLSPREIGLHDAKVNMA